MFSTCTVDHAGDDARDACAPRRRKREHRRDQHERRFDAVAAGLDRNRETEFAVDPMTLPDVVTLRVEQRITSPRNRAPPYRSTE